MAIKRIRIQMKGSAAKPLVTGPLESAEADRLLREEVLPKIGKEGVIELPELVVTAREVASAQAFAPSAPAMPAVRPGR
ncbi:MAG: hypothetical protein ACLP0J_00285 [Solirubrobacteraceae bacterium]